MRPNGEIGSGHPSRYRLCLAQCRLQRDLWVQRPVNGSQEVLANELVQLQIVHVAACADLRSMHHDEHVVRIRMDPGNMVTVPASLIAIG
jgi:hypothetical protein